MNRLRKLKKVENAIWVKILKTEQDAVTFIVFLRLQLKKVEKPKDGRAERLLVEGHRAVSKDHKSFGKQERYISNRFEQKEIGGAFLRSSYNLCMASTTEIRKEAI